ncbi:MAG: ketose-bisphosphate aldolase [Faecalicoccus sp.]|uniref:ketose-bisphosphate aldolase n=1 Tax=Faecalicoccus sp. TaxID=1971758 RepID=UPI002F924BF7
MLMNMSDLLKVANEHNFAVPAFNISSDAMLQGVIESCEKEKSPVIIAVHPNELAYSGDSFVEMIKDAANKTTVPVALHLDHGGSLEQIYRAIRDGFTSVMIDASTSTFEENIELTKKVCAIAHPLNVSVEAELGTIGSTNGDREGGTDTIIYTNPDDAVKFVEASGCDCLAIAIGTAHGIYPKGFVPHLRLDLLEEIKSKVSIPLVLHGGSANPDEEIAGAVKRGVNKINISSDIKAAFFKEARKVLEDQGLREPLDIFPACIDAMNETVVHKIRLFESNNKTQYYKF